MSSKFAKQYQIPPEFPDILKALVSFIPYCTHCTSDYSVAVVVQMCDGHE